MAEASLMDALVRFDRIAKSCTAPRPGSNLLPVVNMVNADESIAVDGEEMDALHRVGWLEAAPIPEPQVVDDSEEWGGIDADHLWTITPAGRAAIASMETVEGGGEHG